MRKLVLIFKVSFFGLLMIMTCQLQAASESKQRPNIVIVLMDNFGYGEVGVYGGGIIIVSSPSARSSSIMLGIVMMPLFSPASIIKVPLSKL